MEYESQEWLDSLTDEEYQEYLLEKVINNLDYLVAEGFVKTKLDENGETLYCMKTDEELEQELKNI
jgi:Fe2+ or Zn2+ uptake regulation protein